MGVSGLTVGFSQDCVMSLSFKEYMESGERSKDEDPRDESEISGEERNGDNMVLSSESEGI